NLNNANLNLSVGYTALPGAIFVILNNDSNDPINGMFNGYMEGQTVNLNGIDATFSYAGGDGNDVTLSVPGSTIYNETVGADFILRETSANLLTLLRNNMPVASYPTSIASFVLNGADNAHDSLTVDFSGGSFALAGGVTFNGGSGGPDNLVVTGGSFQTV